MIGPNSKINIADNSGATLVNCINVPSNRKNVAGLGDVVSCSIRGISNTESRPDGSKASKVRKGDTCYALIVNTSKKYKRANGICLSFRSNKGVLITKQKSLASTRIFTLIPYESRNESFLKLFTMGVTCI